ncbi:MAG: lysophospholipid acyltransferase family protein [Thermoanaerobaculales bacterium]
MPLDPLKEPASPVRRATGALWGTLLATSGFVALILINLLQLFSLVLLPFSRRAFRRLNRWCANTWWGLCVIGAEKLNGTRIIFSGEDIPDRENALLVANHQQMTDIPAIMKLAHTKFRLGDLKFFVKKQLKWAPGIGWGMQFLDCLFIDRDWAADHDRIRRTFAKLVDNRVPVWLVSFVEGTRATRTKLEASRDYARSRGCTEMDHVQVPRTKGFVASVHGLRNHVDAIYDVTIGYTGGVPSLWQYTKGLVGEIHVHVRRFPVETLPETDQGLHEWLLERFVEKDRLLAHFYQTGEFPA